MAKSKKLKKAQYGTPTVDKKIAEQQYEKSIAEFRNKLRSEYKKTLTNRAYSDSLNRIYNEVPRYQINPMSGDTIKSKSKKSGGSVKAKSSKKK